MMTARVLETLEREYRDPEAHAARELVERLGAELSIWREVSEGDRVERAALILAARDLDRLASAVELGLRDWPDLLVAAGEA